MSIPSNRAASADMKGMAAASGQWRDSIVSAPGPCRARSERSSTAHQGDGGGKIFIEPRVINGLARGIHDQQQFSIIVRGGRVNHEIIDDAAFGDW